MAYALMEVKYWYLEHWSWGSCLYVLDDRREPVTLVMLAILVFSCHSRYSDFHYCANDRT